MTTGDYQQANPGGSASDRVAEKAAALEAKLKENAAAAGGEAPAEVAKAPKKAAKAETA